MDEQLSVEPFLSRRSGSAELFLVRHADALPDDDEALPGVGYDQQPLGKRGQLQSQALADRWGSLKFDAIYSSPLRRTLETAAPLARQQNLEIRPVDDIREIYLGGDYHSQVNATTSADTARLLRESQQKVVAVASRTGTWDSVPGSEGAAAFRTRIVTALDNIAAQSSGQRVAVFSHGGVINMYVATVLGLNSEFFFPCANTSVTIVRVGLPRRVLVSLNEVSHLRDAGLIREQ